MPTDNVVFTVQAGFSFSVLIFCVAMLGANKDPTYYLPILTSIIGYWLPAPQYRANGNKSGKIMPNLFMKRTPDETSRPETPKPHGDIENQQNTQTNENEINS